jgi:hypothetical protein
MVLPLNKSHRRGIKKELSNDVWQQRIFLD